MTLNIFTPTESILESNVIKVIAEGEKGFFCLLSNHIDTVSTLTAGVLTFEKENGATGFLAVDEGVLVKKGADVFISTRNAFPSNEMTGLRNVVEEVYQKIEQEEKRARNILAKLEAGISQRLLGVK